MLLQVISISDPHCLSCSLAFVNVFSPDPASLLRSSLRCSRPGFGLAEKSFVLFALARASVLSTCRSGYRTDMSPHPRGVQNLQTRPAFGPRLGLEAGTLHERCLASLLAIQAQVLRIASSPRAVISRSAVWAPGTPIGPARSTLAATRARPNQMALPRAKTNEPLWATVTRARGARIAVAS